jgi:hypothetical protein
MYRRKPRENIREKYLTESKKEKKEMTIRE